MQMAVFLYPFRIAPRPPRKSHGREAITGFIKCPSIGDSWPGVNLQFLQDTYTFVENEQEPLITINVNSVLTKGTYQLFITCQALFTCLDRWHRDVYLWHLVASLSSPPFPFFFSCYQLITLLSCCWVCLYFSSFLIAAIISLLKVSSFFILWNIQVSMIDISLLTSQANAEVQKFSVVSIKL